MLCRLESIIAAILLVFAMGIGVAMATEEAKYTVLEKDGDFEVRQYQPQIVAETFVEGEFKEVGNEGFRRLFDYISGNNRTKRSIPMTAPVSQEKESEKIPMTAPVSQEKVGAAWRIVFFMPAGSRLEDLPQPLDSRVNLREIPEKFMAAVRYSGTWSKDRYDGKRRLLLEWMREKGYEQTGEAVWARYNPPFTPWFLRRNEVLIPVGR